MMNLTTILDAFNAALGGRSNRTDAPADGEIASWLAELALADRRGSGDVAETLPETLPDTQTGGGRGTADGARPGLTPVDRTIDAPRTGLPSSPVEGEVPVEGDPVVLPAPETAPVVEDGEADGTTPGIEIAADAELPAGSPVELPSPAPPPIDGTTEDDWNDGDVAPEAHVRPDRPISHERAGIVRDDRIDPRLRHPDAFDAERRVDPVPPRPTGPETPVVDGDVRADPRPQPIPAPTIRRADTGHAGDGAAVRVDARALQQLRDALAALGENSAVDPAAPPRRPLPVDPAAPVDAVTADDTAPGEIERGSRPAAAPAIRPGSRADAPAAPPIDDGAEPIVTGEASSSPAATRDRVPAPPIERRAPETARTPDAPATPDTPPIANRPERPVPGDAARPTVARTGDDPATTAPTGDEPVARDRHSTRTARTTRDDGPAVDAARSREGRDTVETQRAAEAGAVARAADRREQPVEPNPATTRDTPAERHADRRVAIERTDDELDVARQVRDGVRHVRPDERNVRADAEESPELEALRAELRAEIRGGERTTAPVDREATVLRAGGVDVTTSASRGSSPTVPTSGAAESVGGTEATSAPPASEPRAASQPIVRLPYTALAESIVARARSVPRDGSMEVRFALEPDDLGLVRVKIESRGDDVRIRIVASSSQAADALGAGVSRLSAQMQDAGFRETNVDLSFEDGTSSGDEARERQSGRGGRDGERAGTTAADRASDDRSPMTNDDRRDRPGASRLDRTA